MAEKKKNADAKTTSDEGEAQLTELALSSTSDKCGVKSYVLRYKRSCGRLREVKYCPTAH